MLKKYLPKLQRIWKKITPEKRFSINIGLSDLIAFAALAVAFWTYRESDKFARQSFDRNYRPYVFVESSPDPTGITTYMISTVRLSILNAPAKILNSKMDIYVLKEGQKDKLFLTQPGFKNLIMYPNENSITTITTLADSELYPYAVSIGKEGGLLKRVIRVDYEWIADNPIKYYYESVWVYNVKAKMWEVVDQNAN